jgi:hypothetical protein
MILYLCTLSSQVSRSNSSPRQAVPFPSIAVVVRVGLRWKRQSASEVGAARAQIRRRRKAGER